MYQESNKGFSLIELLVVIGIIGVLAGLGTAIFSFYRQTAGYQVSKMAMRDVVTALDAGLSDKDQLVAFEHVQNTPGEITLPAAHKLLPGLQLSANLKLSVRYDPNCVTAGCESAHITVTSCLAEEHVEYLRLGDGFFLTIDHVAGGC